MMAEAPVLMRIKALFDDEEGLERALGALLLSGVEDYTAYGPTNIAPLWRLMTRRELAPRGIIAKTRYWLAKLRYSSPVRLFAIGGAISGLAVFAFMCIASALVYKIVVGGKPPWTNVPYVVPSYEGTILLGSFGAFFAALLWAGLYHFTRKAPPEYDSSFVEDSYGVNVYCRPEEREKIIGILRSAGASEVKEYEEAGRTG